MRAKRKIRIKISTKKKVRKPKHKIFKTKRTIKKYNLRKNLSKINQKFLSNKKLIKDKIKSNRRVDLTAQNK